MLSFKHFLCIFSKRRGWWGGERERLSQFFRNNVCAYSLVPVSPLCAQFSSVQFNPSTDRVVGGTLQTIWLEILFESFQQEAIVSSSGMGRNVHSSVFSIQHFLCCPRRFPPSKVPWRTVLERLSRRVTCPNHASFRLWTLARRGSCGPTRKLILLRSARTKIAAHVMDFMSVLRQEKTIGLVAWNTQVTHNGSRTIQLLIAATPIWKRKKQNVCLKCLSPVLGRQWLFTKLPFV